MGWPVMTTLGSQAPGSTGTISVTGITDTTNSAFSIPKNLNPPITVVFLTATSYQLQSTDTSQLIEGPISYDPTLGANIFPTPGGYDPGYRVSLAGANQAGDNFLIGYNTNPADNSNGLALAGLYQKSLLNQGTLTWGGAYASLSGNISMEASRASSDYDTANVIKKQASARRDAISGISLEEETMNLGEYQQYYQASAQILASARTIFDTIIQMTRR
jgi:flagellar hook-associated protein 1 FlgK